jgi:spore maturation protein CgeB
MVGSWLKLDSYKKWDNNMENGYGRGKESGLRVLRRIRNKVYPSSIEVLIDEELEKSLQYNKQKTILYVGIKFDYTRKFWGLSYEHYNFYETLQNMGYSLIYFDSDRLREKFGDAKMSKMLREAVYLYHPDILFYFHYQDWIQHVVWREISEELPTKTIIFLADDHWRYEETKPLWKLFDLVCTTDLDGFERRKKEGFNNVFLTQWGCNHFLFKNLNLLRIYDVSFVGQCYGKRREFVDAIRSRGIDIRTFGRGWNGGGGRVPQSELIRIYNQSKISLNISFASSGDRIQIKGRDFEAVGCGSLLLTKDTKEIASFFVPGEEIVTYTELNDALKKIEFYLKNEDERKKIAQKGYERLMREHTMEKRMSDIFDAANKI